MSARALALVLFLLPGLALAQPSLTLDALPPRLLLADPTLPAAPTKARIPHAERALLEAAGGLGGALAFGVASGFAGLLLACPAGLNASPACLRGIGYGALAGVAVAAPPGVFLTGRLLKGGGSFLPTLGGGLLGIGAVLLIAPFAPAVLPLLVFGLPVLGSVAGYELSASWKSYHLPRPEDPSPTPAAVVARF